jgi:hypothetical protein
MWIPCSRVLIFNHHLFSLTGLNIKTLLTKIKLIEVNSHRRHKNTRRKNDWTKTSKLTEHESTGIAIPKIDLGKHKKTIIQPDNHSLN